MAEFLGGSTDWPSGESKGINSVSEPRSKARAIMVWSLSKDDDGLESVHPLTNKGAPLSSQSERPKGSPPSRVGRGTTGAPSVFVDPRSQVPQGQHPLPRRQEVEPTMVLKGRKLDEMRAEVARQKIAYQRKKQRTLVLWALAGGGALAMGWFVGILLSPGPSGGSPPSLDPTLSSGAPSEAAGVKGEVMLGAAETAIDAAPREAEISAATPLDDLPAEEPEQKAPTNPTDGRGSLQEEVDADTSPPRSQQTFTLDDLPAD